MRCALISMATIAMVASASSATSFGFSKISNNNEEDLSSQLSVEVTNAGLNDDGLTLVDFSFSNNVGIRSNVTEIYIDDGNPTESLLAGFIVDQQGSTFAYGNAMPGPLPGGNAVNFEVSAGFVADADLGARGNARDGLNMSSDFVTIRATLRDGFAYSDILDRITSGMTRFGLHIRSIGARDGSDSYVTPGDNTPPPPAIPAPLAASMAMVGLGGLAARRRR